MNNGRFDSESNVLRVYLPADLWTVLGVALDCLGAYFGVRIGDDPHL